MNISPIQRNVQAADLPLEKLINSSQVKQQDKVEEASRQFESMLLRQILTQAQKPLFRSNLFESSTSNSIYQDMITQQLADRISRGGSFGFGKMLEKELTLTPSATQEPTGLQTSDGVNPSQNSI